MAKGAVAKEQVFAKMLEAFPGSFMYNNGKELRIDWKEESGPVQIKVALTAAKEIVTPGGERVESAAVAQEEGTINTVPVAPTPVEVTAEEKKNVEDLLKSLGLAD